MTRNRDGFALVFTLWILLVCASIAMSLAVIGRDEIVAIQNRHAEDRARWFALGCVERTRAIIEETLWKDGFSASSVRSAWSDLDRVVGSKAAHGNPNCAIDIAPTGLALNVNTASPEQLRRLLRHFSAEPDVLVDAIVDWRDADDSPRPQGAETGWYVERELPPPRNAPFTSLSELRLVRGISAELLARGVLGIRNERVLWRRADRAVLSALPGMTDEALTILAAHGLSEISDLSALASFPEMSAGARDSLARSSRDLIPMVTSTAESWVITATATFGNPRISAGASMRIDLGQGQLAVRERHMEP